MSDSDLLSYGDEEDFYEEDDAEEVEQAHEDERGAVRGGFRGAWWEIESIKPLTRDFARPCSPHLEVSLL